MTWLVREVFWRRLGWIFLRTLLTFALYPHTRGVTFWWVTGTGWFRQALRVNLWAVTLWSERKVFGILFSERSEWVFPTLKDQSFEPICQAIAPTKNLAEFVLRMYTLVSQESVLEFCLSRKLPVRGVLPFPINQSIKNKLTHSYIFSLRNTLSPVHALGDNIEGNRHIPFCQEAYT